MAEVQLRHLASPYPDDDVADGDDVVVVQRDTTAVFLLDYREALLQQVLTKCLGSYRVVPAQELFDFLRVHAWHSPFGFLYLLPYTV